MPGRLFFRADAKAGNANRRNQAIALTIRLMSEIAIFSALLENLLLRF
jgi:hypothetical protein